MSSSCLIFFKLETSVKNWSPKFGPGLVSIVNPKFSQNFQLLQCKSINDKWKIIKEQKALTRKNQQESAGMEEDDDDIIEETPVDGLFGKLIAGFLSLIFQNPCSNGSSNPLDLNSNLHVASHLIFHSNSQFSPRVLYFTSFEIDKNNTQFIK